MIHHAEDSNRTYSTPSGENALRRGVARVQVPPDLQARDVWFGILPFIWLDEDYWGSKGELRFMLGAEVVGRVPFHWSSRPGSVSEDKPPVRQAGGGSQPTIRIQEGGGGTGNFVCDLPAWRFNVRCDSIELYSEWINGDATCQWATVLRCLSQAA